MSKYSFRSPSSGFLVGGIYVPLAIIVTLDRSSTSSSAERIVAFLRAYHNKCTYINKINDYEDNAFIK